MNESTQRYSPQHFPVIDNRLYAGTRCVDDLIAKNDGHPLYVYSQDCIIDTAHTLRTHLPGNIKILYSVKANPWQPVIEAIAPLVDGFDTASKGELETLLSVASEHTLMIMTGPGKSQHDLEAAIRNNVLINIESEREFEKVVDLAQKQNQQTRVMLRLNPELQLRTSGMQMSGGAKPFGVDIEQAESLIIKMQQSSLDFQGVHVFCGSQCLDANAIITAHSLLFNHLAQLQNKTNTQFQLINLGGGFGIPYFRQDRDLDIVAVGNHLNTLLDDHQTQFSNTTFAMEFGRYLIGPAGIYVCQVVDMKESRGKKFVITNGGMHHHLAASGNLGQVIRKNYPVFNASRMSAEYEKVTVVGPLCTPLDVLASDVLLAHPEPGDSIVVMQSGAYGLTASPQQFLSHPTCGQKLV